MVKRLVVAYLALTASSIGQASEPMYLQVSRAVFRLERLHTITQPGEKDATTLMTPAGSAFVVGTGNELHLVTARHVVEQPYGLRARVPTKRLDNGSTEVAELRVPREAWGFHPVGPQPKEEGSEQASRGVDVAVARLQGIRERTILKFSSCGPCAPGEVNQLVRVDPNPPERVFVIGFPGTIGFALREQRSMFRSGIISFVAGERFLMVGGAYADERSFLIDSKIEPGNSGSPVITRNDATGFVSLVGIISAANAKSDFGVAEPVSRILETIDHYQKNPAAKQPDWYCCFPK
jgi:hypothetical protein